jgi:CheY-like chemotaxis protein
MSLKVLVVDDDDIIVLLHNILVAEQGISPSPIGFNNGKAVFDYLEAQHDEDDFYLVLLDINMPVMSGWELLDRIQFASYAHRVYVIIATSSVDYEDQERARHYPQIIEYFEKPLEERFFNRIKRLPQIAPHLDALI